MERIRTLVLCRQSPLNLHHFCLTRGFKYIVPVPGAIRMPSDGILHQFNTKRVTNDPPVPSGGDWVANPTTARGRWMVISGQCFELLTKFFP